MAQYSWGHGIPEGGHGIQGPVLGVGVTAIHNI